MGGYVGHLRVIRQRGRAKFEKKEEENDWKFLVSSPWGTFHIILDQHSLKG
jgi:hypothetical protein